MASTSLQDLTPDTREKAEAFIAAAQAAGLDVMVASTLRSCADQGQGGTVVVQGMTLKRVAGCRSWHVWGRAFDVVLKQPSTDRYAQLGALGKTFGLEWGGDFQSNPDPIHFQYHPGLNIQVLCPDPSDCDGALKKAGVPMPTNPPSTGSGPVVSTAGASGSWGVFLVAAAVGWGVMHYVKKNPQLAKHFFF